VEKTTTKPPNHQTTKQPNNQITKNPNDQTNGVHQNDSIGQSRLPNKKNHYLDTLTRNPAAAIGRTT
jgi:hypothetical protein